MKPVYSLSSKDKVEFALFFAKSLDLLCIADFDGYFKQLNPAWTTRLGWTLEDLYAHNFLDFIHPDDRAASLTEIDCLANGADRNFFENRYRHRDGSYRWLRWNALTVPGDQHIYASARDVTRQHRLEREVVKISDREKAHLGRELHDGLCQTLAGIAALGSTLSKRLSKNSDSNASAAASEITKLLNEAIDQARDLAHGLCPLPFNDAGLDGALESLASRVQHLFAVSCTFVCTHPCPGLPREVESHLFRIAQEAVNNAVTHGKGDQVEITLGLKDGEGLLCVRDNGAGISDDSSIADGVGMHTMAYRARLIGGSLTVNQCMPAGTVVACTFPLPKAHKLGLRS